MTFDLDLDLEHTLDAGPCGDHRVQVWWRSSHFCGRSSDLRKKSLQTDGQTDRQTDGRRTPRDCISSWNELKCGFYVFYCRRTYTSCSEKIGAETAKKACFEKKLDVKYNGRRYAEDDHNDSAVSRPITISYSTALLH